MVTIVWESSQFVNDYFPTFSVTDIQVGYISLACGKLPWICDDIDIEDMQKEYHGRKVY